MANTKSRPPKTVEDYLALPDDVRAELIGGELYMTPAPTTGHQDVAGQIYKILDDYGVSTGSGRAYIAPVDVYLPTGDVVQPDVVYVAQSNLHIIGDAIEGAPDLAVEVVSLSNAERDRFVKRRLFARSGIPAYWIVDGTDRCIEVLHLEGDVYRPEAYAQYGEVLATPALPGLRIPLERVFR